MHILFHVGEDVRDDGHNEIFVSKVIPRNSIRLLKLIGEGMYVCMYVRSIVVPVHDSSASYFIQIHLLPSV